MKFLTIVIPCFNEKDSLPVLIENLLRLNNHIDFLIIENGSTDGSKSYLKKIENDLNSNINILYLNKNEGYGNGVHKGLRSIDNSTYIGWIHGDLQFEFEKINHIVDKLKIFSDKETLLFYKGIRRGRSYSEKFFSYYMGVLATYILKMKLYEINAQPTIFSKELVKKLDHAPKDFRFDTYVYWMAMKNNYKVIRDEFNFPKRKYGNSKWNFGFISRFKFSKLLINYFYKLKKTE
tara:strand:+ start:975 stop:1679 length:705 start_codon:yes stop_codon:yes gene_type:complete